MHEVYVPTVQPDRRDYWLHHPRSVSDLDLLGDSLIAGLVVTLQSPDGAQQPARLEFQAEVNCWVAYPILGSAD